MEPQTHENEKSSKAYKDGNRTERSRGNKKTEIRGISEYLLSWVAGGYISGSGGSVIVLPFSSGRSELAKAEPLARKKRIRHRILRYNAITFSYFTGSFVLGSYCKHKALRNSLQDCCERRPVLLTSHNYNNRRPSQDSAIYNSHRNRSNLHRSLKNQS